MTKTSTTNFLFKRVSIRRDGKVVRNVLTKLLLSEIKQGRLRKGDEISADEVHWVRLDRHFQLSKFFLTDSSKPNNLPSDFDQNLSELSEILKDLNQ